MGKLRLPKHVSGRKTKLTDRDRRALRSIVGYQRKIIVTKVTGELNMNLENAVWRKTVCRKLQKLDIAAIAKPLVEQVANNLVARCVNRRGLVTFKVNWQAGGWVVECHCGRGTNASLSRGRTCDGESPSDERQCQGEEGTKERLKVWGNTWPDGAVSGREWVSAQRAI